MLAAAVALAALASGVVIALAASPAQADTFFYREFVGQTSGKCMDLRAEDNATLQLWQCFNTNNQNWRVQFAGTSGGVDFYYVISRSSPNGCLGIAGDSFSAGVPALLQACFTGFTQFWYFRPHLVNGIFYDEFVNLETGLCLDARGNNTGNGTILQQWQCNQTGAQYWQDVAANR
jgi:hypothetical protein